MADEQNDDLLPDEPDESSYSPVSHIKVGASDETLDFTLSLRTTDGGISRFRLTPQQACEIMAWFPFVAVEQAKQLDLKQMDAPPRTSPIRITQLSAEAGHTPGEALLHAIAGHLNLTMAVDLTTLRGLQKWIDRMLRFVPPAEEESKH